jgi:hypothetical protein
MKPIQFAFGFCLILSAGAGAQPAPRPVMRDAATHDQLSVTRRQEQSVDPMRKFTPAAAGKDPSKENIPADIISRSDILCFNGLATLVPKQAIIFNPPQYADRIGMKEGARIVPWMEFYAANRGWIGTMEISLKQAEGKEPLPEKPAQQMLKGSNMVVATFQGGPISKLVATPATETK